MIRLKVNENKVFTGHEDNIVKKIRIIFEKAKNK